MAGDLNRCAPNVVRVIRLGELMAQSRRRILHAWTVPFLVRRIRRVDVDLYRVDARRNDGLPVASVEDEVLATELEHVGVGPAAADSLKAVACEIAAAAIRPGAVAVVDVVRIRIEHAKAPLGGLPFLAVRVDQAIR